MPLFRMVTPFCTGLVAVLLRSHESWAEAAQRSLSVTLPELLAFVWDADFADCEERVVLEREAPDVQRQLRAAHLSALRPALDDVAPSLAIRLTPKDRGAGRTGRSSPTGGSGFSGLRARAALV